VLVQMMQIDHRRGRSGEGDLGADLEVLVDVEELSRGDLPPAGVVVRPLAGVDHHRALRRLLRAHTGAARFEWGPK
jgi:hypothetical protein